MLKDSGILAISYAPKTTTHISTATDYVLVYAKSLEKAQTGKLTQTEAQKARFSNPDNDPKGPWQEWGSEYEEKKLDDGCVPGLILKGFDLKHLENPKKDPVFRRAKEKANEIQAGTAELKARVDFKGDFIGGGLVLDPFAGSGTTGEAILQLNQTEKTNRTFTLIEQGNPHNGDTFARNLLVPPDDKPHEPLPGDFKYLKLTKQIDSQTILEMEREELIEAILSTQLDTTPLSEKKRESQITEKVYRQCALEGKDNKLTPIYHIYARTQVYSPRPVSFHKIPDHLLLEFGITLMSQITSFNLHGYQRQAADQLTEKYLDYRKNPLKVKGQTIPFLKLLSSVTGSGKTAILAQTVSNLLTYYPEIQPLIFWLSCNKVVVQQTYHNLKEKYKSLVLSAQVKSFLGISPSDITQLDTPLIYVDTIQKFSVQNKETQLIKERKDYLTKKKRDLIVIYDEAHNLTDSQVEKILELQPQALILASGTPSLPSKLTDYQSELKDNGFEPLYVVPFTEVKEKKMVKGKVVLGGYKSQMEEVLNEMLDKDWMELKKAAEKEGLPTPKIIYVCKTNLLELSSTKTKGSKRDNPQVPFELRNAPPILIWRHLVKRKGVDPSTIAIYADVAVAKEEKYALDIEFTLNLFNKGKSSPSENTYEKFIQGNYQHIIFNKSLAEVAVEQIIGRVLRQPFCRYYASEELNKAYFHIRIDENKVFEKIINELNEKLKLGGDIEIKPPKGGISYLKDLPPKPDKIGKKKVVNRIPNYEKDYPLKHRQNIGKVQRTEKDLGSEADKELRAVGEGLINTYRNESLLRISLEKPYEVKGIKVEKKETKCQPFKNAIHEKYSGLNNLEKRTATELDNL
ncbi:17848_t:CDS:10, partial [Racocetra fulgida]